MTVHQRLWWLKAAAIAGIGAYPHCKDANAAHPMALIAQSRESEATISVFRMRYRDKEASRAQTTHLRMELRKAWREHDALATEMRELCHVVATRVFS